MTENARKFLKMVWRRGEMDPEHAILVNIRGDTDIDVVLVKMSDKDVIPMNYELDNVTDHDRKDAMVTYCCTSAGGGHSVHTRKALYDLMKAMERDNLEDKKNGNSFRGGQRYD